MRTGSLIGWLVYRFGFNKVRDVNRRRPKKNKKKSGGNYRPWDRLADKNVKGGVARNLARP